MPRSGTSTVTTTSRSSTSQPTWTARIARAIAAPPSQAVPGPAGNPAAAARAARSAAACARCRATTTAPNCVMASAVTTTAATSAAPSTAAAPSSPAGLSGGDGPRGEGERESQPGKQIRAGVHGGHDERAVPCEVQARAGRRDEPHRSAGRVTIAAGGEPGGLAGGVDAADLGADDPDPGQAHHRHHDQRRDRQSSLDRSDSGIADHTAVFSARVMMFVSAPTIESPVTTV